MEHEESVCIMSQMFQRLQGAGSSGLFYIEAWGSGDGFRLETASNGQCVD